MDLEALRIDCALKQKKGLPFIAASVIIWSAVFLVQLTTLPILSKNLLTFCATAPLLPLAYMLAKLMKVDFTNKRNPLTNLGLLFSLNQLLYLLIAMWVYPTVPEKLVMVLAMIFGAHLLPYSWLYQSKSYLVTSILIPIVVLLVGNAYPAAVVAGLMIGVELMFSLLLLGEVRKMPSITAEATLLRES